MKSNAIDTDGPTAPDENDISPTTVFAALATTQSQHVVQYLVQKPGAIALQDLAEYLVATDGDEGLAGASYERSLLSLYHTHVPRLTDLGLTDFDAEQNTLSLRVDADALRAYLDIPSVPRSA